MARVLAVILSVLLLAGCGAGASLPTATSAHTTQSAAATATAEKTPAPSPTILQATASAEATATLEPTITLEEATPAPTASYPLVTITDLEPGPGRDVGILATTNGKSIFYSKLFLFNNAGEDYICIYRFDPKTRKSKEIRRIPGRDYIVRRLFTDSKGSLLYFKEDLNNWMSSGIYRYSPSGDQLLVAAVQDVVRVDQNYIYYHPQTEWDDDNPDRLMAYDLKNGSIVQVNNQKDIVLFETGDSSVTWAYQKGQCRISIQNSFTKQTRICSFPTSAFPFMHAEDFELINIMKGFVVDNTLILFINSPKAPARLYIFKIDIKKNKIISKKEIPGENGGMALFQGKIYFYSFEEKDEDAKNRRIQSYTISTGKLRTVKRLADCSFEDGLIIEAVGGYLWVGSYSHGDGTGYWDTFSIPLK